MPARKRKADDSPAVTREFIGQIMADAGLNSRTQSFQRAQNMIYEEINQSDVKRETLSIDSPHPSFNLDDADEGSWDSGSECDCKHGRCPLLHCDSSEGDDDDDGMTYSKDFGKDYGRDYGKGDDGKVDSKAGGQNDFKAAAANDVNFFQQKPKECAACLRHKMRLAAERRKRSKARKMSKSKKRSQSRKRRR